MLLEDNFNLGPKPLTSYCTHSGEPDHIIAAGTYLHQRLRSILEWSLVCACEFESIIYSAVFHMPNHVCRLVTSGGDKRTALGGFGGKGRGMI